MSTSYTPLHVHSIYSNLDGFSKIPEIVDRCIEIGAHGVCISDHAFATSHYELYELCKKKNIKPIFAVESYLAPGDNTIHSKTEGFKDYYHITMIAKTIQGYKNLMSLIADSFINGKYRKPRTDMNKLERFKDGVIVLQSCLGGVVSQMLSQGRDAEAEQWARNFQEIFGENYFLELTYTKLEEQHIVNQKTIALAEKLGIEVVITPDSHYTKPSDSDFHKAMVCININKPFVPTGKEKEGDDVDEGSMFYTPGEYFLKSREDLEGYYSQFENSEQYFENTNKIADSIEWIHLDKKKKFPCDYEDPNSELMNRVLDGLNQKLESGILLVAHREDYIARIKEELDVIVKMGFSDYFIEIQNIVKWSNAQGITTGPGRGCFWEDTLVATNRGQLRISEVVPNMEVFSSQHTWEKVISVFKYEIDEPLTCITYKHYDNTLYRMFSTIDHKYLVLDRHSTILSIDGVLVHGTPFFLEASKIDKRDHFLVGSNGSYATPEYTGISILDVYNTLKYKCTVYDLMVEGDNTFMIGNNFVHNSGAGSFINFLLNITRVNPLDYNLLFSRMLNSGRSAFPNIEDILHENEN